MDKIIKAFNEIMNNKKKFIVNTKNGHQGIGSYGEEQDEYNEKFVYYKHDDFPKNIFLRETYHTDSYNDNERVVNVQFVEGQEKTITVYEPI